MNEPRNEQGYPCFDGPTTRPRARLECAPGSAIGGSVTLDQSTDNSSNRPMPWVALASLFGGLGFGGLVVLCLLKPWETSDRASQAELRAEFSQRIARTEALAELARKEAGIAKDMMDVERAKRIAREELKR